MEHLYYRLFKPLHIMIFFTFLNFCRTKIWPCLKVKQNTFCPLCSYHHTIIVSAFHESREGKIYPESKVDGGNWAAPYPQSVKCCSSEIQALLMPTQRACYFLINSSQWCLILMGASSGVHLWRREFSPTLNVIFNSRHLVFHPFCSN